MPRKGLRPGMPAPDSGQYGRQGPRGGKRDGETTGVRGKRLPPTPERGETYFLKDSTKHSRKRS